MNQREGKSREEAEKYESYWGKMKTFHMRKTPSFDLRTTLSCTPCIFFAVVQAHWLSGHAPATGAGI